MSVDLIILSKFVILVYNNYLMSQSINQILERMRTEVKYSAFTTMTMRLLKVNNLYESSKITAKS